MFGADSNIKIIVHMNVRYTCAQLLLQEIHKIVYG